MVGCLQAIRHGTFPGHTEAGLDSWPAGGDSSCQAGEEEEGLNNTSARCSCFSLQSFVHLLIKCSCL